MLNRIAANPAAPLSPKLGIAILLSLAVLSWMAVIRVLQLVIG